MTGGEIYALISEMLYEWLRDKGAQSAWTYNEAIRVTEPSIALTMHVYAACAYYPFLDDYTMNNRFLNPIPNRV